MDCVKIPGYPTYEVNDQGEVFSLWFGKRKRLKPYLDKDGYEMVSLYNDGKQRTFKVHAIVLTAFRGPCPTGMQCRHLNGIPDDNRLENLIWGTPLDNYADRDRHGTTARGERNGSAKLCPEIVRAIRYGNKVGRSNDWLAEMAGVTPRTIYYILSGKYWSHVV